VSGRRKEEEKKKKRKKKKRPMKITLVFLRVV
jgi:hypothetical protein